MMMAMKIRVLLVVAAALVVLTPLALTLGNSGPASAHGKPDFGVCMVGVNSPCNGADYKKKPPQPQPGVGVPPWCYHSDYDCHYVPDYQLDATGGNITLKR